MKPNSTPLSNGQDLMNQAIVSVYRWLVSRPGYMLMTADDTRLAAEAPQRFRRAWLGLMALGLLWGVGMACLHGAAWTVFGEVSGVVSMPVAAVVLATVAWLYRRAVVDLARTLAGKNDVHAAPIAAGVTVLLALAMLGLKSGHPDHHDALQWYLRWIPRTMYRTLILAPLWGAWAMLITPQFCRPTDRTEPAVAQLIAGCGPMTAAACMLAPLAATLYAYRMYRTVVGWWWLSISAAPILAAIFGGWLVCRREAGPTRRALLAANMITQITFILTYLANIR